MKRDETKEAEAWSWATGHLRGPRTFFGKVYGQEKNLTTSSVARMNLVLHGIEDFQIAREDTLRDPAGRSRGWRSGAPSTLCAPAPGLPAHRRAPQTAVIGRALHGGCTAPPLPAQRGSAEHAVGGAAQHRALAPLRIDPQLEVQALPVEHAQAVADPVVPAVLRRGEADPRRPHEPAPHRQARNQPRRRTGCPARGRRAPCPPIVSRPHSASAPLCACPPHDGATRATKRRCCTALAESEIRLWWWPRYVRA